MSKRKTLVAIDGKSVFYRGYYAMPNLSLPDGTPTGGVFGFSVLALEILKKYNPDYVVVAWDKSKTNIRSRLAIYPEYKAGRKPMPEDMREQIPYLQRLLDAFGWPLLECDDYEADDIMAGLSDQAHAKNIDTILISSDQDLLQLANDNTTVVMLKKGLSNLKEYSRKSFEQEYGFTPEQFIDFKAIKGDSSDNIPGVRGIGDKGATTLMHEYGSLDEVYAHIDEIKGATQKKLIENKEMAYLSKKLVTIMRDAPVEFDDAASAIDVIDPVQVKSILIEYQFRSLLKQIPESWKEIEVPQAELEHGTAEEVGLGELGLSKVKPLLFVHKEWVVVSSESHKFARLKLSELTSHTGLFKKPLIGFDCKQIMHALLEQLQSLPEVEHDIRIGHFLLNALSRDQSITGVVGLTADSELTEIVPALWAEYSRQLEAFKKEKSIQILATDIEWPIIPLLAQMEHTGIKLDASYLASMSDELRDQLSDIEQEIYGHADMEFNIASPSQLADVLFNKLGLPTEFIKKTKTGYSTAASELAKLQSLHPVIDCISKFREWSKLKSTYVDTLPNEIAADGRIHTTFALDVAATGRLSSHDPNLQNIPIRTELGNRIRHAFVPEKGNVFVNADYSQFELRLAAAMSGDEDMIKTFNEDADIHVQTAALVAGVPADQVTKQQRYAAKAVNFGIMYGLSAHGLSQSTGMDMKSAKEFIDRYFELRKPLRNYIDTTLKQAHDDGYVETLLGRRRPTPDVKSSNYVVREAAKRAAQNMPIQGTEADIMKVAMINLEDEFNQKWGVWNQKWDRPKQLLQIHDSILVECPEDMAEDAGKMMKQVMEDAYKLKVNLTVDYDIGKTWGEV